MGDDEIRRQQGLHALNKPFSLLFSEKQLRFARQEAKSEIQSMGSYLRRLVFMDAIRKLTDRLIEEEKGLELRIEREALSVEESRKLWAEYRERRQKELTELTLELS